MEFTVELRYQSGSSTVLSTEAGTADQALNNVRDPNRPLIGIHVTAPSDQHLQAPPGAAPLGDDVQHAARARAAPALPPSPPHGRRPSAARISPPIRSW